MKHIVSILTAAGLLASITHTQADHHETKLHENLVQFEEMLGDWADDTLQSTVRVILDGRAIEQITTSKENGKELRRGLIFWNSHAERVEMTAVTNFGLASHGYLKHTSKEGFVFRMDAGISRFNRISADEFSFHVIGLSTEGKVIGLPEIKFSRVKK